MIGVTGLGLIPTAGRPAGAPGPPRLVLRNRASGLTFRLDSQPEASSGDISEAMQDSGLDFWAMENALQDLRAGYSVQAHWDITAVHFEALSGASGGNVRS
jgi:hypothetical protein